MAIIRVAPLPRPSSLPRRRAVCGQLLLDLVGRYPSKDQLAQVRHPELHRVVAIAVEVFQNIDPGLATFHINERAVLQVIGDDRHPTNPLPLVDVVDQPKGFDGSVLWDEERVVERQAQVLGPFLGDYIDAVVGAIDWDVRVEESGLILGAVDNFHVPFDIGDPGPQQIRELGGRRRRRFMVCRVWRISRGGGFKLDGQGVCL